MKNYKILIVDDGLENLETITSIIETHHPGYILYQANSGKLALELIEKYMPDLVLSDWEMPEISGIELMRLMQQNPATQHIPVIIVSGIMISSDDLKVAIEAGAVDFIRKPINVTELLARMNAAITIAEYHKQLIKEKENTIVENVLFANEVNRFLNVLASSLKSLGYNNPDVNKEIPEIILKIEKQVRGNDWQKFTKAYNNLHPDYKKRLLKIHPGLTPSDLNLSALIRLGLSVKELADIMFVTPESMRVSRSRLRKKLELDSEQNLQTYLSSL